MLFGSIMALVLFCLIWTAANLFEESLEDWLPRAIPIAILSGLIFGIAPKIPAFVAVLMSLVVIFMMVHLGIWWSESGSNLKELFVFVLLDLLLAFVASSAAARILDITHIHVVVGLIRMLPWAAFVLSIGFYLLDMIFWREELKNYDCEEEEVEA